MSNQAVTSGHSSLETSTLKKLTAPKKPTLEATGSEEDEGKHGKHGHSRKSKHEKERESKRETKELETTSETKSETTSETKSETKEPESQEPKSKSKSKHSHKHEEKLKKKLHESRRVVFVLGALLGLLGAVFFTTSNSTALRTELDRFVNFDSMNDIFEDWGKWSDMLPTGFLLMLSEYDMTKEGDLQGSAELFLVGRRMRSQHNLTAEFNVVMVPGVISTGIESWSVNTDGECPLINHFRKRLWGSFYMLRTMVLDKACWLKHIMLDFETGLDPPNIKLRAAQGFEAADFFMAGYWIWNKILQNLAVIGYGPENMVSAAYDWRLAYLDLEKRDGYFSKLKSSIELNLHKLGKKSILVGHSMGSQVIFYFMKWAEASGEFYGNGGPNWVNEHIEAFVDISGSSLGTPKSITALLSGEMKDTVQLNALAVYGLEKFFSRRERVEMLRSFGGIASMIPKGGEAIWGNLTHSPDDPTNTLETNDTTVVIEGSKDQSFGAFITHNQPGKLVPQQYTVDLAIDLLLDDAPEWYSKRVREQYSFGLAKTAEEVAANNHDHLKWSNPLEASLPNAPDMKIYCFYGVGKPTERAYTYADGDESSKLKMVIDAELKDPVYFGDGDGTVLLLTHTICHEWKKGTESRFNPGGSAVTIVEIKDEPDRFDIRGGAKTADHVDILGSAELNELVLRVAAGQGDQITDRYASNLREIAGRIDI